MDAGTIRTDVADGIATVTFGHPKGNSLPGALLTSLAAAIETAGRNEAAQVIVLRSEGTGPFCAGASFDEFKTVKDAAEGKRFFSGFAQVILAMIRAPKFVVARVQGKTAGGGVGLVAASDYALATSGAALRLSELAVGIGPFVVGPVIEKRIGLGAFAAMAIDADWRSAEWGERHGLYAELLPTADELDRRVAAFTAKLAGFNPEAMRRLKEVTWEGTAGWPALLAARAEISGTLVLSDFTKRAIGA
ncbi:MAG: enoyl-CoA hydratase/isomerase family protein [Gemmatimonadales bacterium]|nr:enoyl-CoA hydratase/isomerase family protein [Gemmatimonadales bacterium]